MSIKGRFSVYSPSFIHTFMVPFDSRIASWNLPTRENEPKSTNPQSEAQPLFPTFHQRFLSAVTDPPT